MTGTDVLVAAQELITDKKNHTVGYFARSKDGYPSMPKDTGATCWCLYGAVIKVAPNDDALMGAVQHLLDAIEKITGNMEGSITTYNDDHTHAEILQLVDDAIELSKEDKTNVQ
jgi:hypothetical protein